MERKLIEKLALVASHTDNVVIITNQNGLIEWVNNAFTKLTEYTLDEVTGRKPSKILQGKNTDPSTTAYMRQQLDKQQGFKAEVINYSKSGREYLLEINVQPIFSDLIRTLPQRAA
jgi:PAS domain S-box-containing protein